MKKLFYFLMVGLVLQLGIQNQMKAAAAVNSDEYYDKQRFMQAIDSDDVAKVKEIIARGRGVLDPEWLKEANILSLCVNSLAINVLKFLIDEKGIDAALRDSNHDTPALYAAKLLYKLPSKKSLSTRELYSIIDYLKSRPESVQTIGKTSNPKDPDEFFARLNFDERMQEVEKKQKQGRGINPFEARLKDAHEIKDKVIILKLMSDAAVNESRWEAWQTKMERKLHERGVRA